MRRKKKLTKQQVKEAFITKPNIEIFDDITKSIKQYIIDLSEGNIAKAIRKIDTNTNKLFLILEAGPEIEIQEENVMKFTFEGKELSISINNEERNAIISNFYQLTKESRKLEQFDTATAIHTALGL